MRRSLLFLALIGAVILGCGKQSASKAEPAQTSREKAESPATSRDAAIEVEAEATVAGWHQFRGPHRDAKSPEQGLLTEWPEGGPKLVWTYDQLGLGFSSIAISGDQAFVLGTQDDQTAAFALNADSGKLLWSTPFDSVYINNWGDGPRSTPTVDGDYIYVLSGRGTLACLERATGAKVWSKSLTKDFGGAIQNWGFCESPLIDGGRVVVTPGGDQFMVALDKATGEPLWTSSGVNDAAQYASIVIAEVDGVKMYVTMTKGGLVGVSAADGRFLWRYEGTKNGTAVIPTPVIRDRYIYSTSGYGAGCGLVELSVQGEDVVAKEIYSNKTMKNHHGGVLLHDGKIFGYSDGPGWICQDLMTGELVWRSKKMGKGSVIYFDNHLVCYSENEGDVALVEATGEEWVEKGRFSLPRQSQANRKSGKIWAYPAISNGRLYLRDQELLFQFDIRAN